MSFFTNIFNYLRALYGARYEPEYLRPLADMYWRTLLSLALASVVGVIMFGAWEFVVVVGNLAAGQSGDNSMPPTVLNRAKLESTLSAYDARQTQFQASLTAPVTVADPSR